MPKYTSQLTQDGYFFLLGKLYYIESLLNTQFENETSPPIGVGETLEQIEEAKEPLLRILMGPPNCIDLFSAYLNENYGIDVQFDCSINLPEDKTIIHAPLLSLVKKVEE